MNDPLVGQTLKDTYRIEQPLADGGMSQVYLATQLSLSRHVVLKVLSPGFNDPDFIDLFLREARVCSQINHPNIVSVIDFGQTEEGIVFLAMELLDGETLGDIVTAKGPLSTAKTLWLMEQVCNGIYAAHQQGVIHRDLKPNNIMVSRVSGNDTIVKVLDFGISKPLSEEDLKHTRLGMVMGTPGYLAPEQIEGQRSIDPRADIYALGAILYFCLTGVPPYKGAGREIIMNKQLSSAPAPLDSFSHIEPTALKMQAVIDKAMQIDKSQRYPDARTMLRAMLDASSSGSQSSEKTQKQADSIALAADAGLVTRYQFVYSGHACGGVDFPEAVKQVAALCHFSEKSQEALLQGKRLIIRKNLSFKDAQRLKNVFDKCSLEGSIEEMPTATRIVSRADVAATEVSMPAPVTMEPVTISDIQAINQSRVVEEQRSQAGTASEFRSFTRLSRRKSRKRVLLAASALILLALVSVSFLYKPLHYKLHDILVYSLLGNKEPRGVSEDKIKIGMSAAFSGSARELGRSMQVGIEACFMSVNAEGGIHGRKLELVTRNDNYEPDMALENIRAFLAPEDGVLAMLGNVGTPTAKAILPEVLANQTVLFGTFSGASLLRNDPPDRYVFNYRASYAQETEAIVHYLVRVKELEPNKIAVFYQDDSFGLDGLAGVERALAEYHVHESEILTAVYQRNSSRVQKAVAELSAEMKDIQALVIVGTYSASAAFIKEMRDFGYQGYMANVSFVGSRALAELLLEMGAGYTEKLFITQVVPHFDSYATGVLKYRRDLEKYFPSEEPNFVSLEGYIAATIFIEGLRRSGRYFTQEELVDKLETINSLDLGIGSKLSFDASNHQASQRVWAVTLKPDGTFENLVID